MVEHSPKILANEEKDADHNQADLNKHTKRK